MSKVRVNISTAVNAKAIRRETRNGRDLIIVPSATLPDDVVMNGIRYPAAEIAKGYKSLERSPAPLGHPNRNGAFLSAKDPEGLNQSYIGAWNENVRQENGRVLLDKVIDVAYANQLDAGRRVIEAIEKGDPIHTSTGLYGNKVATSNAESGAKFDMTNLYFDHDAILLDEPGAATPEQGVGMLVNAKDTTGDDVAEVVNSSLDNAMEQVDYAGTYLIEAVDRLQRLSRWETVKSTLLSTLLGKTTSTNNGDTGAMDKAQMEELNTKLDGMSDKIANAVAAAMVEGLGKALAPVTAAVNSLAAQQNAEAEAKKTGLINQVVKANIVSEDIAKTLPVAALEDMVANAKPGRAAAIAAGATATNSDKVSQFKLPSGK